MKKFLIILSALLLCITPFFAFHKNNNKLSVSAYDETYNYTATISTDYSTTFLEGIDSVESVNFDFASYVDISYSTAIPFEFWLDCGGSVSYGSTVHKILLQPNWNNKVDINADCFNMSILLFGTFTGNYNSSQYYLRYTGTLKRVIFSDYCLMPDITNDPYEYCRSTYVSYRSYSRTDETLSQYLDLNSETDYTYQVSDLLSYNDGTTLCNVYNFFTLQDGLDYSCSNLFDCTSNLDFYCYNTSSNASYGRNYKEDVHYLFKCGFRFTSNINYSYSVDKYSISIKNFEIVINKPVNRLENTLVIYNYDYDCAISSVSSVEYCLSDDNDLYKAKYSGTIPNNKFVGFVCSELQNRIYDEYIYMYLTFKDNKLTCDNGQFSLGFDFNFSRYYEPFVIKSTDLNNYDLPRLNKPDDWWDFGGWIRYGFIWLLFYNPIISPISSFIVSIFGVFINVFKFILGFELGTFLLAFIGFIVIYNFFVSISPIQSAWKGINNIEDIRYKKLAKKRYRENLDKYAKDSKDLADKQRELDKKRKNK